MKSFFRIGVTLLLATIASFALVADYRYNECSGATIKNHAGSDLTGQLSSTGAILTKGESTLSLLGGGSMVVKHNSKLDLTGNMTISIWVKQSKREQQALVTRGETNADYFLGISSKGKIRYRHTDYGVYSENSIPLNEWTHVVVTREHKDHDVKIYINSIMDSTHSYQNSPVS
ncbi:MAG TPA: LamG domain-containing protein, partial [Campylobacterales bacterium]|nr:LamG domain-containing protein [Campylobacterales bacterium]